MHLAACAVASKMVSKYESYFSHYSALGIYFYPIAIFENSGAHFGTHNTRDTQLATYNRCMRSNTSFIRNNGNTLFHSRHKVGVSGDRTTPFTSFTLLLATSPNS